MGRQRAVGIAHVDDPVPMDLDALLRSSRWLGLVWLSLRLLGLVENLWRLLLVVDRHNIGLASGRGGAGTRYVPRLNFHALAGLAQLRGTGIRRARSNVEPHSLADGYANRFKLTP